MAALHRIVLAPITTLTGCEFDQDIYSAMKAPQPGPVFIADGGRPTHVLLSIEAYRKLTGAPMSVADALADLRPEADFDFEPPRLTGFPRAAEFD